MMLADILGWNARIDRSIKEAIEKRWAKSSEGGFVKDAYDHYEEDLERKNKIIQALLGVAKAVIKAEEGGSFKRISAMLDLRRAVGDAEKEAGG